MGRGSQVVDPCFRANYDDLCLRLNKAGLGLNGWPISGRLATQGCRVSTGHAMWDVLAYKDSQFIDREVGGDISVTLCVFSLKS